MTNTAYNSNAAKDINRVRSASHQHFTTALGGLVSSAVRMQEVSTVLDVGCGEGNWVLDLARQYPRLHVTGIDMDERFLDEATRFARFHGISNITFRYMDPTEVLLFGNNTFDLVHMGYTQFLQDSRCDSIIRELVRVLRPGGWLHLVEFGPGATSSIAFDRIIRLFIQAIHRVRKNTSDVTSNVEIAAQLYDILLNAYLLDVSYTVHAVDFSPANTFGAKAFIDEVLIAMRSVKAIVCQLNPITMDDYDALLAQAHKDMMHPDACGYGYLISATGCKNE